MGIKTVTQKAQAKGIRSRPISEIRSWWIGDFTIAALSMLAAFVLSPSFDPDSPMTARHIGAAVATISFGVLQGAIGQIFGLSRPVIGKYSGFLMIRAASSVMISMSLLMLVASGVFYQQMGRYIILQATVYTIIGILSIRWIWTASVGMRQLRVLFLSGSFTGEMLSSLCKSEGLNLTILRQHDLNQGLPFPASDLPEQCLAHGIDEVVEAIPKTDFPEFSRSFLGCLMVGISVSSLSSFMERHFKFVPIEEIGVEWFLQSGFQTGHPIHDRIKRTFDVVFAIVGLIGVFPLIILAAIASKIESQDPVFYSQIRIGAMGRPFRIWKLRSMSADSEQNGPQWATLADPRVTKVGRLLRRTRIDETPQFWNILRGDMSLIGPRPERPEFVEKLAEKIPYYNQRHLLKPGLTGWAQINYPYGASTEDSLQKLKYDLYYVKHVSISLDVQIILSTVGAVMKGAR